MYNTFEYSKLWKITLITDELSYEESDGIFRKAHQLIGRYASDIGYSDRVFQFDAVEYFNLCKRILDDNRIKYDGKII